MLLQDLIISYIREKSGEVGESAMKNRKSALRKFVLYCFSLFGYEPKADQINRTILKNYRSKMTVCNSVINKEINYLYEVFKHGKRIGVCEPIDEFRPVNKNKPIGNRVPDIEEVATIFNAIKSEPNLPMRARNLAILATLAYTGMRAGALIGATLESLDLKYNRITVIEKGGHAHTYFISKHLRKYLKERLKYRPVTSDYLFCSLRERKGNQLSIQFPRSMVKKYYQQVGIDRHLTAHSMRHFFVTYMGILGVPIETTAKSVGHNSTSITMQYYHPTDSMMFNILDKFQEF